MTIEISDLKVEYGNNLGIDFQGQSILIEDNDKLAVIGKNGSGKTTLVNCILGEIEYKGNIESNLQTKDIGVVFQENEYSDLIKVNELISLVTQIKRNQKEFQLFCEEYSISSLVNKYVKKLSVGEQQRLTVGLVLSQPKKMYILDELTSGLDYEKRENLLSITRKQTNKSTVIQISHYFEEIENWATKIMVLNMGELVFYGSIKVFYEKFYHDSVFKIGDSEKEKFSKELLLFIENKKIKKISNEYFYTSNQKETENIIKLLLKDNISYEINQQSIKTTYMLSLEEHT